MTLKMPITIGRGGLTIQFGLMEFIPILYFLVIFGALYLIARRNGPDCLERAERVAGKKGGEGVSSFLVQISPPPSLSPPSSDKATSSDGGGENAVNQNKNICRVISRNLL